MTISTISIEPIKDREPIDEIGAGDFVIVGDASDGGKVKPAIIDEIDLAPSKLNEANYNWATIPDKPLTFTPSSHGHSISEVDGLQEELDALSQPDYSSISGNSQPIYRSDGSLLQNMDTWRDTLKGDRYFFDSTYLVTEQLFELAIARNVPISISSSNSMAFPFIGRMIKIVQFNVVGKAEGNTVNPDSDYWRFNLDTINGSVNYAANPPIQIDNRNNPFQGGRNFVLIKDLNQVIDFRTNININPSPTGFPRGFMVRHNKFGAAPPLSEVSQFIHFRLIAL